MAKYQHPTLLLVKEEKDGKSIWSGSGRCPGKCELDDFRSFCEDSGFCELASGHPHAFGAALYDEDICAFLKYSDNKFKDIDFSPRYKVDYIFNSSTIKPKTVLEIGNMKSLWGQELEEALIAIENIPVTKEMV